MWNINEVDFFINRKLTLLGRKLPEMGRKLPKLILLFLINDVWLIERRFSKKMGRKLPDYEGVQKKELHLLVEFFVFKAFSGHCCV